MGPVRRGAAVLVLALALVMGSLGLTAGAKAPSVDPVLREWPSWPYPVTCSELAFDPITAFSSPTGVELGSRPSELALKGVLEEQQEWVTPIVPTSNWRLLAETHSTAEFASGQLSRPGGPAVVSLRREDGAWKFSGLSSGCRPTSIVNGMRAITWTLAEDQGPLRKGAKTLLINLGPGPCSGGRSQNERAMKPVFKQIGRRWLMVMRLKPLPKGGYTCQGIIEPPLRVKLPVPLGNRKLYDGATYPPTDVAALWRDRFR